MLIQIFKINITKSFFITKDNNHFTYGSFWLNAEKLAQKWKDSGVKPGDVIVFLFPNDVSLPCCLLSCAIGGFIACPIVHTLHSDSIDNMISSVKPRLIIREIQPLDESLIPSTNYNFQIATKERQPFLINFTSGLTGEPKAMCHCLDALLGSAASFGRLSGMNQTTRLYHILPMAYMAGIMNTFLAPLMAGGTIVEGPLFSPDNAIDFWSRPLAAQVNTLSIIPSIAAVLTALTRNSDTIREIQSQIRQVQCTSTSIPLSIKKKFKQKFSLPLQDCYGITELGGPLTFQPLEDAENLSDESAQIPEIDVSIRHSEGRPELWIRSPFAMLGYYQNNEMVSPFDGNGFMDTGDLASFQNGKIAITGRKKDIIIRGGINISPAKIENCLGLVSQVNDVAVVGIEHPFWGEEIVAFIVTKADTVKLHDALISQSNNRLSQHERPDRIIFINQLPRSFVGKVVKNQLKKHLLERK